MDTTDIAWRAEAHRLPEGGMAYVAIAPLVQQVAAVELLSKRHIALLDGSGTIEDPRGRRTTLAFVSIREPIFDCYEVDPAARGRALRPVLLTCGFDAEMTAAYLRRAAVIARESAHKDPDSEGGFVGTFGLREELEHQFFARIPRDPMPASDFMAAVARAASELNDG